MRDEVSAFLQLLYARSLFMPPENIPSIIVHATPRRIRQRSEKGTKVAFGHCLLNIDVHESQGCLDVVSHGVGFSAETIVFADNSHVSSCA